MDAASRPSGSEVAFSEFFRQWKENVERVQHRGRSCLMDRSWQPGATRAYRPATPEEIVRQGFIAYLLDHLRVPHQCLRIEKGIRSLNKGRNATGSGRCDLVVCRDDEPLLLVEFKRETETESLIQTAYRQAREYAEDLPGTRWVLLCNGRRSHLFEVSRGDLKSLNGCEIPPELSEVVGFVVPQERPHTPMVDHEYFNTQRSREQPWAVPYLIAFQSFILGQSLLGEETHLFRVLKDFGADWGHLRNAGGKHTKGVRGLFHFYEVELDNGDRDILSLTIAKYDPAAPGQYTSNIMTVGLGSKSMLEMQTSNRFIARRHRYVTLSHSGQMTAVKGYGSRDALKEYAYRIPDLVDGSMERVVFGRFEAASAPQDVDWKKVTLNIVWYAVERERLEQELRQRSLRAGIGATNTRRVSG